MCIQNFVKHIIKTTIFAKHSILDVKQIFEYTSNLVYFDNNYM